MKMKRIFCTLCSAVVALSAMSVMASADAEPTVYCQGGIAWMIRDQWDHRNSVGLEALTELGDSQVSVKHTDVNITGNGQYEVAMEGYVVPEEDIDFVDVGNLGVTVNVDMDTYPDFAMTLDEAVIDGVTYSFTEQPDLEDSEGSSKIMKLKNAYGNNAVTEPAMDVSPWRTTDPITIKFTVSGFPTDKATDYADEQIVTQYGEASDASSEEESSVEESSEATSVAESTADSSSTASADSSTADKADSDSNTMLYIGIGVAAIVVIAVIVVVIKKK